MTNMISNKISGYIQRETHVTEVKILRAKKLFQKLNLLYSRLTLNIYLTNYSLNRSFCTNNNSERQFFFKQFKEHKFNSHKIAKNILISYRTRYYQKEEYLSDIDFTIALYCINKDSRIFNLENLLKHYYTSNRRIYKKALSYYRL